MRIDFKASEFLVYGKIIIKLHIPTVSCDLKIKIPLELEEIQEKYVRARVASRAGTESQNSKNVCEGEGGL